MRFQSIPQLRLFFADMNHCRAPPLGFRQLSHHPTIRRLPPTTSPIPLFRHTGRGEAATWLLFRNGRSKRYQNTVAKATCPTT